VLSSGNRLTSPLQFREAVRRGRRRGGDLLVVHLWTPAAALLSAEPAAPAAPPRVGFVVSKAVGPAVTRNLVKRRLRHLCRDRVAELPAGSLLVVRALPGAAPASYEALGAELDRCLNTVTARHGSSVQTAVSR
jgi:ribonuclease P protein component